jgi:hypothetical protein
MVPRRSSTPAGDTRTPQSAKLCEPRREPSVHGLLNAAEVRAPGFIVIMVCRQLSWQTGVVAGHLFIGSISDPPVALNPQAIAASLEMTVGQPEAIIALAKDVAHEICRSELGLTLPWGA